MPCFFCNRLSSSCVYLHCSYQAFAYGSCYELLNHDCQCRHWALTISVLTILKTLTILKNINVLNRLDLHNIINIIGITMVSMMVMIISIIVATSIASTMSVTIITGIAM